MLHCESCGWAAMSLHTLCHVDKQLLCLQQPLPETCSVAAVCSADTGQENYRLCDLCACPALKVNTVSGTGNIDAIQPLAECPDALLTSQICAPTSP